MFFKVTADENFIHKQIFSGTMSYLPRVGEKIMIDCCCYIVEDIKHFIKQGSHDPEVKLGLRQVY